jgi:hypothetical protein
MLTSLCMRPKAVQDYLEGVARLGGNARAKKLGPKQRQDIARKAANARWAKAEKLVAEITTGTKKLLKTAKANDRRAVARLAKQQKEKTAE